MNPPDVIDRYQLVGGVLANHVRVDEVVARGGFGIVYRGYHLGFRQPVAVKVLYTPDHYSDAIKTKFHEGFVREARLIYSLTHPAIVRVHDFGVAEMPNGETAPWMVLEWLHGRTLTQLLRARSHPFTPDEALALLAPVFDALDTAHRRGVAHRDVTPANVFVCDTPQGPYARLIDFGVACELPEGVTASAGRTATSSTVTAFSREYAAPEQVAHTRTGPWTDVHALGLILTEMLTLQPPYPTGDDAERVAAVMSPLRPTPGTRGLDVGAWELVLQRAMAQRPDRRFPNAGAFFEALQSSSSRAPLRLGFALGRKKLLVAALLLPAIVAVAWVALVTPSTPAANGPPAPRGSHVDAPTDAGSIAPPASSVEPLQPVRQSRDPAPAHAETAPRVTHATLRTGRRPSSAPAPSTDPSAPAHPARRSPGAANPNALYYDTP